MKRRCSALERLIAAAGTVLLPLLAGCAAEADDVTRRHGRGALAVDSVPRTVADAESFGRRYPQADQEAEFPPVTLLGESSLTGPGDRRCVDVANYEWIRSGEFIGGPFALYRASWAAPPKFVWVAAHQPRLERLQVKVFATPLDAPDDARVYATYRALPRLTMRKRPIQGFVFLPRPGRWMLVTTAGANWGCFILTLA
jgi:hypothetical protein